MKFCQAFDCEITSPPSTAFALLPDEGEESDLAFLAELVDLPTANRAPDLLRAEGLDDAKVETVWRAGHTSRISVQSLGAHLQDSPNSSEEYAGRTLAMLMKRWNLDEASLLSRAFWVRTFWF